MVSELMNKAIICYLTYSGNTEEVAELIRDRLRHHDIESDMYEIGFGIIPDLSQYRYVFIGTFTWDYGKTPDEVKDFVLDVGYKPDNVMVFGTGDTQFGEEDAYCKAAKKLAKFYNSKYKPLMIEQSPRGRQEKFVIDWVDHIIKTEKGNDQ